MSAEGNKASYGSAEGDNSPLVVSPRARGSTCAAGVPAQFIINMFPLSANCDLLGRRKRPREDVNSRILPKNIKSQIEKIRVGKKNKAYKRHKCKTPEEI